MRRTIAALALALLIGFVSYRVALAVAAPGRTSLAICGDGKVSALFDTLTGFPSGWSCAESDGQIAVQYSPELDAHWLRSVWLGLGVAFVACVALWWFGRRQRSGSQRRSQAVGGAITTLALTLSLLGCGSIAVPITTAETHTTGDPSASCGVLMHEVVDVIADPTSGTPIIKGGGSLTWPTGYSARRAGTEVEVLNRAGNVVLTTGSRYWICPAEYLLPVIGMVKPCPDCALGSGID